MSQIVYVWIFLILMEMKEKWQKNVKFGIIKNALHKAQN